jgi:hypothetical protein
MNCFHSRKCSYWILFLAIGLLSCNPRIAYYNDTAYTNAISLKVETASLMNKANTPYQKNQDEIDAVKMKMLKATEYARWIPNNNETIEQWNILNDTAGGLFGNFITFWKREDTLGHVYIQEAIKQNEKAFDKIILLESKKIHQ